MTRSVDVLGIRVSAVDPEDALDDISRWIEADAREYVCVTGVHGVIESQKDPDLADIHNAAGLVVPDGMPLVWCGRWAGAKWMSRVYGPDLMLEVCGASVGEGWRHFFYGASPGVPENLSMRLRDRFPGIEIAGTHSPPFREMTDEEIMADAAMINRSGATIVWVGLSTPKQERWMARSRDFLSAPVLIGVGAAFDMHAGRVRQAPMWMRRSGLEWLFRLAIEPGRLWRRYMTIIPTFMWKILRDRPVLSMEPASLETSPNAATVSTWRDRVEEGNTASALAPESGEGKSESAGIVRRANSGGRET